MTINEKTVSEIAQRNPTSEGFFNLIADRKRSVRKGVSTVQAIRTQLSQKGYHPVPQELLSTFKELQNAGFGKLEKNMFKWYINLTDLGTVAKSLGYGKKEEAEVKAEAAPVVVSQSYPNTKKRFIASLGTNKEVDIEFTPNLTKEDIQFVFDKLLKHCQK